MATRLWAMRILSPKDEDGLQKWYGGVEDYLDAEALLAFRYRFQTTVDLGTGRVDRRQTYALFATAIPAVARPETLVRFGYRQLAIDSSWFHGSLAGFADRGDFGADARFAYSAFFRGDAFAPSPPAAQVQLVAHCPDLLLPVRNEREAAQVMRWFHEARLVAALTLPALRQWVRYAEPPLFYPAATLFLHVARVEPALVRPLRQAGYHGHPLAVTGQGPEAMGTRYLTCPALFVPPATSGEIIPSLARFRAHALPATAEA